MRSSLLSNMQKIKKIKVLGYPFAGGQGKSGVEQTPSWLQNQDWFKNMSRKSNSMIEYEEIKVTSQKCNQYHIDKAKRRGEDEDLDETKNIQNVMASSIQLRNQTYKALKEGYYPIVLGGDHSQAIGSISGMKKFQPNTKILWMDAHIDANTPSSSPSKNAHGMPLAYLSGIVPFYKHLECVDLSKDLCYFGIRSFEDEEVHLIQENKVLVFEPKDCEHNSIDLINQQIKNHFKLAQEKDQYWISFDIDSVDADEFKSTGTAEGNGVSLEFAHKFFQKFIPKTIGMDLTEVNFELSTQRQRKNDEQTFRELFELICHQVNVPVYEESNQKLNQLQFSDQDELQMNFL